MPCIDSNSFLIHSPALTVTMSCFREVSHFVAQDQAALSSLLDRSAQGTKIRYESCVLTNFSGSGCFPSSEEFDIYNEINPLYPL